MTDQSRERAGRSTTRLIVGLLLCLAAGAAIGDPVRPGTGVTPAAAVRVDALLDCRLWLSAVEGCPGLTGATAETNSSFGPAGSVIGEPDYPGIKRDTYYFLGLQLTVIGALYFMPESVSGWSEQQKEQDHTDEWWDNVSDPTWDDDEDYINYLLHPYWGAAYYVRARERGFAVRQSFWYSFLLSTLYETGVEALFEPVSIQDFFVTPIVGSWLGGYFMDWRRATYQRIDDTGRARFRDKALLVATDPLGNVADFIDRRLGLGTELRARPFVALRPATGEGFVPWKAPRRGETYGVTLTLRW